MKKKQPKTEDEIWKIYTTRRFMFGLALFFVYVFLLSF